MDSSNQAERSENKPKAKLNWILPNQLAVGPIPLDKSRQQLLIDSGIKSILTVCSEKEGTPPETLLTSLYWNRLALVDSHSDESLNVDDLTEAIDLAHYCIIHHAPLYVHCVAGMERSPSVCVGYLCKYKGMKLWEALNIVKKANPRTNIIDSQIKAIKLLST